MRSSYELSEQEVLRLRLLVAEQGLVGIRRTSPREEEARALARARTHDLEFSWGTFLARGMQQGVIPEVDPRLLTRANLGLYNSVWHWYRPRGNTFAYVGGASCAGSWSSRAFVQTCWSSVTPSGAAAEPAQPAQALAQWTTIRRDRRSRSASRRS